MAKLIKVRGETDIGNLQLGNGEFISGRQLTGFSEIRAEIKNAATTSAVPQSPHGTPRDISFYNQGVDKPYLSVQTPATDAVALAPTHDRGDAPQLRQIVHEIVDPRALTSLGCGVHHDGKSFNGYERRADGGDDFATNRIPPSDPGTNHDEATLNVAVGGTVSGVIDFTGDTDLITVNLVAGETYSFYLYGSGANAVTDTFLTLLAPDGTTVINEDDDGGVGLYSLITFTATSSGTYNLVAESFANPGDPGLGDWSLHVTQRGADEAPSAPPSAVPVTLGLNYGFINPAGTDEDVYSITLTAGFIYNFEVAGGADYNSDYTALPTGEIDTIVRIYDSAGTLLFSNDDIDFPDDISSAVGFIPDASGTYYVEVDGYSGQSGGYVLEITETDLSTLDPLDAIDWGGPLNVVDNSDTLLIYFATTGQTFDGVTDLGGWTPYLQAQALAAFQTYSQFADLTFAITTNQAEADFTLVTTESDEYLAYFNPPGETNAGVGVFAINGTGWDPTGADGSMEPGGYGFITLIHEIGHGLGMAHPHDNGGGSDIFPGVTGPFGSYGIFDLNQGVYTTMSYNDGWQLHPDVDSNGFPVPDTLDYGYQGTPMALDIALMQIKYGAVAHNTGNDVYTLGAANVAGTYYQAIWDTGGTDTIAYAGSGNATIDLTAATLDYSATGAGVLSWVDGIFGGFTIANGVVIENATGGSGNDILVGNSVANVLTGNDGNDTFFGGEGDDTFVGGNGTDTATYLGNQADYTITAIVGGFTITDNNLADGDDGTDTFLDGEQVQFADGLVNLFDAPGNQAPTLTGFGPSVVFNEQAVNGAPQLLDVDVTFTDTDNNFDGGTLVLSGALAEDVVGIRNQGNLAGQVGVSGANLSYGGVVIGTIVGGNGSTLTVTFNAQASAIAVEAVIENLTYANASNNPTANRTFTLNVTDDEGASLIGSSYTPGPYVELTGVNDPFANPSKLPTLDANPTLAFVDVNNDGDIDIITGTAGGATGGTLRYFENNGAGVYVEVTGAGNPFNGFDVDSPAGEGYYSSPFTIDIDGDGDLDLVIGSNYGYFFTFQNNNNGTWTQLTGAANPLDGIQNPYFADGTAIDFDGDGDMDIVSGSSFGDIYAIQNNGDGSFTLLTGGSRPFAGIDLGGFTSAASGDIDGDGDDDLIFGLATGTIATFINNGGGSFTQVTGAANPFNGIDPGTYSLPVLVDLDGDGDADLVLGDSAGGDTRVWNNTGTFTAVPAPTIQVTVNAQNDAPAGTNGSASIVENTDYTFGTADFGFSDTLEGDDFAGVVITTLPGNGSLTLNNVAVTAGQFVTAADITAGLLVFTPDADENGASYASFTFQVRDDGGTANGGIDTDPTANTFAFTVTPDNFAPVLTDVDSPVTFLENTVNATPQILDADVTLVDAKGFANGSVVVSGLLAEDRVGIQNEGTGAGQIGVAGADVTYEGVVIGTFAGGVGNTFTVTLNAAATTAAVEALLEHITYGNVSNTPTETRTLSIQVYDDEGLGLPTGATFSELTGGDNPFGSFQVVDDINGGDGNGTIPTFVDVDGDGDVDLVIGSQRGVLQVLSNNGDGTYTELTGAANPLDGFDVGASGTYSAPAAIDIDGDGDLDLVVGSNYGDLLVLENDGVGGWTNAGFVSGVSVYAFSTPTAVDLDGDGLQDLVLGSLTGFFYGFHNNGDGTFTELTGANDPFLTIGVPYFSAPGFVDIDGDGDFDLVAGDYYGGVTVFTNEGGTFVEAVDQPFAGETFSSIPAFAFHDIDGDGDLDAVVGSFDGDIRVFENVTANGAEIVVNVTPEADGPPVDLYDETNTFVATFGSIQEAVDAASDGYRVHLFEGIYVEQVVIDGIDNLTIDVEEGETAIIQAPAVLAVTGQHAATHLGGADVYAVVTAIDSLNLSINGVTIDGASSGGSVPTAGADFAGVFFRNSSGELIGVDITGVHYNYGAGTTPDGFPNLIGAQVGTGVVVDNDTLLAFTMTGGSIEDFQKNAGRFWEADLDISGVTVTGSGAQGASGGPAQNGFVIDSGTGSISGNTLTAIGYAGPVFAYSVIIYVRGADNLDVTNNTIVGTNGATLDAQVLGIAFYDDNAANNGGTITGNIISYVDTGIDVEYELGAPAIIINGNIVTNVDFTDALSPAGLYFEPTSSITLNFAIQGTDVTDYITGAAGNDAFFGLDGDDELSGLDGNDYLDGGVGIDTLTGGLGDDTFAVDNFGDQVIEADGEGNDSLYTTTTYVLAAGQSVELLAARDNSDTAAMNLIGNEFAQVIYGNNGANFINGGGGADIMLGFGGDDTYVVDNFGDQVFENAGGGNDSIYTSTSYQLAAGQSIELLSALDNTSTEAMNLLGNEVGQAILGNNGSNFIDGGAGADVMLGFGGNDVYAVDDSGDLVFEAVGGGTDAIYSTVSFTLGAGQSVETLAARDNSATTALNFTGNEFANTILGNNGANVLDGKEGNDLLIGYGGADTFAFTTALGANNVDTVFGFVAGTDKIALDDAIFTGIGPVGALNANAFVVGSAAADASDRIIYDAATGQLFYDADGNGAGAAVLFATLSPGLALTASDFQVI